METTSTSDRPTRRQDEGELVWVDDLVPDVCWRLLGRRVVGRVGFVSDGRPCVLPVNYGVVGEAIVFRTATDTSLHGVPSGAAVAFEIDDTDEMSETGWSVVVHGTLVEITGEADCEDTSALAVHPWAPGRRDRGMKITPLHITGRAISRRRSHVDGELLPYMAPD